MVLLFYYEHHMQANSLLTTCRRSEGSLSSIEHLKSSQQRHRIMAQMKEIKTLLIEANSRRERYKIHDLEAASLVDPMEELATMLMDTQKNLKVLSIVGFGGIGKTTIAKWLYDKFRGQFHCEAFFTVSRNPDIKVLLNHLKENLHVRDSSHACEIEDIIGDIREHLKGKRYLIVVDDLWDQSEWNVISCAFPNEVNGSRVIVTTRMEGVASIACHSDHGCIYRMKPLTMDGQGTLRRRKPHGIQHPERGSVLQEIPTDLTVGSVNINPERGSVLQEITADWTDDSVNIRPNRAAGAENGEDSVSDDFIAEAMDGEDSVSDDFISEAMDGEDYVSDDFIAEAMDGEDSVSNDFIAEAMDYVSDDFIADAMEKMQAAVSRIDDLRSNSQLPTIYPVSREHNENYENDGIKPVAVRIGLLNWREQEQSKENLQDYKWYCVQQLINHHSSVLEPARTRLLLRKCLNTVIHVESEIRRFYSGADDILIDSNILALMMLLDGCFILHRLLKYAHVQENEADSIERLYGSPQEWELVKRDLLLFENQIPFLVLRKLLAKLEIDGESEHNLVKGSLRLFRSSWCCSRMLRSECSESDIACDKLHHLLHLFYLFVALPPKPSEPAAHVSLWIYPQWIFCAKELEEAGVRFRKREQAKSFLDIKFDHGVLEIPPLQLDGFSNVLFRNLIAFEKSYTTRQCIFNYAAFINDLMQTPEDSQILRRHGILVNMRDTSSFFNGTCIRMILPSDNYLVPLMENLRKYKDSRRHGWRAELMRSYCRDPWLAIKVLGTSIVLVSTVLQTFYSVYGYYKPRK